MFSVLRKLVVAVLFVGVAGPVVVGEEITTGSAVSILQEQPPAPPQGFNTAAAAMLAVQTGKVKLVAMPPGDEIEEQRNVEYGRVGDHSLKLNLYAPKERSEPLPGIIMIHGGAWKAGRKEDYAFYGRKLASKGYVVASIDYRLSQEAVFPAAIQDCKCAVRWMRANAKDLGVNPEVIGVGGGSAGGHLAMMVGYCQNVPEFEGDGGHANVSSNVQCVVNLYGPYDLTTEFVRNNPFARQVVGEFLGASVKENRSLCLKASPAKYLTSEAPPTLILHGTVDDIVPINQSDLLSQRLKEVDVPYIYDRLPGWPHAMDLSQDVNDRCVWFMERFFDQYLKQSPN
ncbi:MAG: alpha/beta hydrolase [Planctomycetaceae bacterium]|nr:alpha/beta hydrolase [Planctomycetaceae bacterium]